MPRIDEVPGEEAAPAADLEHQAATRPHGFDASQDPRGAGVRVEREPEVVHQGKIVSVVRATRFARGSEHHSFPISPATEKSVWASAREVNDA
jgi:hypothetical protein